MCFIYWQWHALYEKNNLSISEPWNLTGQPCPGVMNVSCWWTAENPSLTTTEIRFTVTLHCLRSVLNNSFSLVLSSFFFFSWLVCWVSETYFSANVFIWFIWVFFSQHQLVTALPSRFRIGFTYYYAFKAAAGAFHSFFSPGFHPSD